MAFMTSLRANPLFQTPLRILQFLSAIISLGLFSSRLRKIISLAHRASASNGAVEGILAAASAYTLAMMFLRFCVKGRGASMLRWLMVLLDILFVGGFIAVAVLTRPGHGASSGPCSSTKSRFQPALFKRGTNCKLPWGTFVLAILSTLLHAITALFHEVKDRHNVQNVSSRERKQQYDVEHEKANVAGNVNNGGYQNGVGHQTGVGHTDIYQNGAGQTTGEGYRNGVGQTNVDGYQTGVVNPNIDGYQNGAGYTNGSGRRAY